MYVTRHITLPLVIKRETVSLSIVSKPDNCSQTSRSSLCNKFKWKINGPFHSQTHNAVTGYVLDLQGLIQFLIFQLPLALGPAFQPNTPPYQQGEDATTQNCACLWCSGVQRTQAPTTWYPAGQQDPRHFGVSSLYNDNTIPTADRVTLQERRYSISKPGPECQ
ncbi:hypothetical protein BJY52DRAFT_1289831 [Lactarius psammicola]|nr:hypothetical protein BJY52DRAFT_1289831 [Lactarius psammicola]